MQHLEVTPESTKNHHLEHLEDLIFNRGYAGAQSALDYVESIRKLLSDGTSATKLTVKWDGCPAIICGIDPADGRFFVGTKAVFSKSNPRRCKSTDDIRLFYSEHPGLVIKLESALRNLPKLNISGVLQGDLMFTEGDVTTVSVNNEDCYVFTPNTITYTVPVNSQLGQTIAKANIGIIFHTMYEGDTINDMTASFGVDISGFEKHSSVWFDDATYKDYTSLAPLENIKIQQHISATSSIMEKLGPARFNIIIQDKGFARTVKPYINKEIRRGVHVNDPHSFLKGFVHHYTEDQMKGIELLSGGIQGTHAQKRFDKIKQRKDWLAENSATLLDVLAVYNSFIEVKQLILQKLYQVDSIGTFQKTNDGYTATTPEGFVAIGHNGSAVKLVNRLEFSRTNFAKKV